MTRTPILAVPCLTFGLALGTLTGSHLPFAGAALPHSVANSCPPSKALLTLSSGGDVTDQKGDFSVHGPFTISWNTHRADSRITKVHFSIEALYGGFGLTSDKPGKGSSTSHYDCSRGCPLQITSTNLAYSVTVSQ